MSRIAKRRKKLNFFRSVIFGDTVFNERGRVYSSYYTSYLIEKASKIWSQLFVCHKCFKPFVRAKDLEVHLRLLCRNFKTPGKVIYEESRDRKVLKFYEVDGKKHRKFCRNLSLFAKFWINSKEVVYKVRPFLFYLLTVKRDHEHEERVVGYFSKLKSFITDQIETRNLSTICVFPNHARNGYGSFLVDLSYRLSVWQGKPGHPEGPVSKDGQALYD